MVDSPTKSFGIVDANGGETVSFELENLAKQPIVILGVNFSSSCTCAVVDELPMAIPPGEDRSLTIEVRPDSVSGEVAERLRVYTDYPTQPEVVLHVFGRVSGPDRSTASGAASEGVDHGPDH